MSVTTPLEMFSQPEQALEQLMDRCNMVVLDATFIYVNSMSVSDNPAYTRSNSLSHEMAAASVLSIVNTSVWLCIRSRECDKTASYSIIHVVLSMTAVKLAHKEV